MLIILVSITGVANAITYSISGTTEEPQIKVFEATPHVFCYANDRNALFNSLSLGNNQWLELKDNQYSVRLNSISLSSYPCFVLDLAYRVDGKVFSGITCTVDITPEIQRYNSYISNENPEIYVAESFIFVSEVSEYVYNVELPVRLQYGSSFYTVNLSMQCDFEEFLSSDPSGLKESDVLELEMIDFSNYSNDELNNLYGAIKNEMTNRESLELVELAKLTAEVDIPELSYEDLVDLKVRISNAISLFDNTTPEQEVWYDENNVKITCVKYGLKMGYGDVVQLNFDFIVENNSEKSIWAGISEDYANGWAVGTHGNFCDNELAPGKKIKSTETIYIEDCDVYNFEDLAKYEFVLWVDLDEKDSSNSKIELNKEITTFPVY